MFIIPAGRRRQFLPAQYQIMLLSCLVTGVLGHAPALFRKFSFHDDQYALFGVGTTYLFGRWMLGILAKAASVLFGGHYSAPLFNGLASFVLIGAAGCLMLHMLSIRSLVMAGILGALMVLYPSVTGLFGYMFTAPYYMTGMLMAVAAVWLFTRKAVPSVQHTFHASGLESTVSRPTPEVKAGDHVQADTDIWASDNAGNTAARAAGQPAGAPAGTPAATAPVRAAAENPKTAGALSSSSVSLSSLRRRIRQHYRLKIFIYMLASIILLGSSAGVYQAYLPLAMGLLVLCFLSAVLERQLSWRRYFETGLLFIAFVAVSTLFYLCMNRIFLALLHISMSDYASLNVLGNKGGNADYPGRVLLAFRQFLAPDAHAAWNMYPLTIRRMYQLLLICCIVLALRRLSRIHDHRKTSVQAFVLLILFPLAVNFIFVLSDIASVHTLMMYPGICIFWLAALLIKQPAAAEEAVRTPSAPSAFVLSLQPDTQNQSLVRLALQPVLSSAAAKPAVFTRGMIITGMLMLLMATAYLRFDSICYMKAEFLQSEAIGYFSTLATRMQSTPGYQDGMDVIYLNPTDKHSSSLPSNPAFDEVSIIPYADATLINDYTWPDFMANWCGFRIRYLDVPDGFEDRPEIRDMPSYPDDGSMKVVGDVLVVKF